MTALTIREVREIIDLVEDGRAASVEIDMGETRLRVVRAGAERAAGSGPRVDPGIDRRAEADRPAAAVETPRPVTAAPAPTSRAASAAGPEGCVAVCAPLAGVFYRAPSPDAPPFVEVGQSIKATTDVCIIEVMKVMNNVKAGVAGTVERIDVDNEMPVEYRAALVWIRPEA